MGNIFGGSHWVIFAAVGVAVSYGMRVFAWAGARQGAARIAETRRALGLPAAVDPAKDAPSKPRRRTRGE